MNNQINPHSFLDFHRPTRNELQEFLKNVSSFGRNGVINRRVMCAMNGTPIPAIDFMCDNYYATIQLGRRLNPNETLVYLPNKLEEKKQIIHRENERNQLKKLKKETRKKMIAEGENPNKWERLALIT